MTGAAGGRTSREGKGPKRIKFDYFKDMDAACATGKAGNRNDRDLADPAAVNRHAFLICL